MKLKPVGNALKAFNIGIENRKAGKLLIDNPYKFVAQGRGATASWWTKGWQQADAELPKN